MYNISFEINPSCFVKVNQLLSKYASPSLLVDAQIICFSPSVTNSKSSKGIPLEFSGEAKGSRFLFSSLKISPSFDKKNFVSL
jgi:hypothetical protein